MERALFVLGPTGVGKSGFAIKLAKLFNGEIISADSVQVYKGLNIGSAKITTDEMQGVAHHAIDILQPDQEFSVFEFVVLTKKLIAQINQKGKLPIVVGGTGLYVKALLEGYDFGGSGRNSQFREKLWAMDENQLFAMLQKVAPERAAQIEVNDKKKLIRALEIVEFGSQPKSHGTNINFLAFALTMPRERLYEKINARVDEMVEQGLIKEVADLKAQGLTEQNQSMKAIGYKEVLWFLDGKIQKQQMIDLIKQHTRNYAKRQMTFIRGMKIPFFDVSEEQKIIEYVRDWYDNSTN